MIQIRVTLFTGFDEISSRFQKEQSVDDDNTNLKMVLIMQKPLNHAETS